MRIRNALAALAATPFLFFAAGCGGETPAARAIEGEATGDYEGISGAEPPPAMREVGPIDTIPVGGRPLPDTTPIQTPPPPQQPPQR
jgi:hypothetical protein